MTKPRNKIIIIHKDKSSDIGLLNLNAEEKAKVVDGFNENQSNTIEI